MIKLYSGTPGSGKSLHVAERIYWKLKNHKEVIANFEIDVQKVSKKGYKHLPFRYIDNSELKPKKLIEFSKEHFSDQDGKLKRIKEDDILLVIDECQILFNSREWQKSGRADWLTFFTQHRKYGYEIVLVAQFDGMIDRQIRSLIEYEFIHRKVSNFGLVGKIMSFFSFGKLFCSVQMWYPLKERLSSEFFTAHRKYYQIYDSYNFFNTEEKITQNKEGS